MRQQQYSLKRLASKYWDATITDIEKHELRQQLADQKELDDELKALQMMLQSFETMADDYKDVEIAKRSNIGLQIVKLFSAFTAAAVIIIICYISLNNTNQEPQHEIYCYVNGEPITDIDIALEQTKYFDHISELSETIVSFESLL